MKRIFFLIAAVSFFQFLFSQEEKKSDYDPKKEVVFDGKRYRVWNSYLTVG
ncbi:MAG: hypothetical protein IAF38_01250, partial [Bacteroidia bacterium]|nr:hypothetical protein [Bacteroidia bacterium]